MNTRLNKKVKKDLDAYFKGYSGSDPEVHHSLAFILKGALTDANFHSEAKRVFNIFPKAKKSKRFGNKSWEDSLEQNHGVPIAKSAKWDGYEIIDAIAFFASMFIGGPVGAKISSLKEGMNENLKMFVSRFINEVTHSYEYEDMSSMGEDENDKEEIRIGNYQTKYFHVCPTASTLYGDMESNGVDMDMAERSARLLDALFFIEEHIQRGGYKPETDYIMVAKNIAKNIMKMGKMLGLEKEHSFVEGHVNTIVKVVGERKQSQLEERVIELTEKNVPTDKAKWAASKAAAKKKFDVYPSAYANAWAAKNYKGKGGGWKTESVNEGLSVTDERHFGKKGIIIMIDDNGKKISAIFKNKKNADKYNRNKSSDLQALLKLAKNTPYPKAIDESVNEGLKHNDMYTMLDIAAGYSSTQDQAASQMWYDEQDLYDYLKSDHIPKKYHKKFYKDIQRRFKGVKESNESVKEAYVVLHSPKKGVKPVTTAAYTDKKDAEKWAKDLGGITMIVKRNIKGMVNEVKEPEVITQLRKIVKNKQNDLIKDTKSGKKVRVDMNSANLMVQVYDALKQQSNKNKFVKSGITMMGHMAYKLMKKENTSEVIEEAEYQGRKVELNKPMQGDSKKFKVYVKNAKGNVTVVHFGQKGMVIKKDNPKARKSFRARMNCDNPGPKWKANYWSCRKW